MTAKKNKQKSVIGRPRASEPLVVTSDRRRRPDTTKIARAVIDLALREAAREAAAQETAALTDGPLPATIGEGGATGGEVGCA